MPKNEQRILAEMWDALEKSRARGLAIDAFFMGWLAGMLTAGLIWALVALSK